MEGLLDSIEINVDTQDPRVKIPPITLDPTEYVSSLPKYPSQPGGDQNRPQSACAEQTKCVGRQDQS